jgi:aspartate racemase
MKEKIIGILGGMGPEATADLFHRIIKSTPVEKDQDHPRTVIYSNSKIPDRTPAILSKGLNPIPEMVKASQALEKAGADFIIMPCNTGHYFLEDIQAQIEIPILNMIEMTADKVRERYSGIKRAGLIATDGTLESKLYHESFQKKGIEIITPSKSLQREVMKTIYKHIKKGDINTGRDIAIHVAKNLLSQGADIVINGCTEISLVLKQGDIKGIIVDPLQVLADTAVEIGLGKRELITT